MNTAHEGMGDMGEWAESHPITRRAHRAEPLPEPHYTAPQGRPEQGWPVRRCTAEMACWAPDDQSQSADAEVLARLLKGVAVVLLACLCAWAIASYLELARVS